MGRPVLPIGPSRPQTNLKFGRPVAPKIGHEAIGAGSKAGAGLTHSHPQWGRRHPDPSRDLGNYDIDLGGGEKGIIQSRGNVWVAYCWI
jgi:hypothetical protein